MGRDANASPPLALANERMMLFQHNAREEEDDRVPSLGFSWPWALVLPWSGHPLIQPPPRRHCPSHCPQTGGRKCQWAAGPTEAGSAFGESTKRD